MSEQQSSADSAVPMAHPRHSVYFMCQCCEEENPENAVCCREDIGIMPDGTWLCDNCYSDCEKTAYGLIANDVEDFEFPRFEDLPRPAPYIDSAMRTEPLAFAGSEDDPTASPAWNDGCDFAMTQLCIFLGVNQSDVEWDAATETVDGDVQAVIGNILRAKFGEDWGPRAVPQSAGTESHSPAAMEGEKDTIVNLIHEHVGFEVLLAIESGVLTGVENAAEAILAELGRRSQAVCADTSASPGISRGE